MARGLEHLHSRNLIHRDVKPANILIGQNGIAKLTDFGLAKRMHEASHLTGTHQSFGTPHYMPYEQTMNARRADARSDIFALGATLYHLLTGEVPFPGDNAVEILGSKSEGTYPPACSLNPLVPPAVEQLLDKMMARNPVNRFQSATELIAALEKTGLAAETLSCLELDIGSATEDSISNSGQPTKPDLHVGELQAAEGKTPTSALLGAALPRCRRGVKRKVRLTTGEVIARIQQGKLPSAAEARDHAQGIFRPLRDFPEFQNYLTKPGAWWALFVDLVGAGNWRWCSGGARISATSLMWLVIDSSRVAGLPFWRRAARETASQLSARRYPSSAVGPFSHPTLPILRKKPPGALTRGGEYCKMTTETVQRESPSCKEKLP